MQSFSKAFAPGREYLFRFDCPATVLTSAGEQKTRASGEAVLMLHGDHPSRRGVSLTRFGVAAASVRAERGPTGVITVVGTSVSGIAAADERGARVRLEMVGEINYESLDHARIPDIDQRGCYYIPATEPAAGTLEGWIDQREEQLVMREPRLDVVCAASEFEEVLRIDLHLEDTVLAPVFRGASARPNDVTQGLEFNGDENVCVFTNKRKLICQPVAFRTSPADPTPTGGTIAPQFATAQAVWGKGCIDIEVMPTVFIDDATLKTSNNPTAIRASFTDANPSVIEVYFVANPLTSIGGGSAGAIGVASCKVVMAEPNSGNPVLLAHELGHVLGLFHPVSVNSDAGTVMAPTGSAMAPGTSLVTHIMCASISNPVLQTLPDMCCFSHDIGDHYIRDFPVDVGAEPSDPLPAGMTRYSMSNVWNRLSNTPGGYSATTGPDHEQPVRFNADMTPRSNWMFAKVEQINNLKVRDAVVKFYRKTPGAGGGGANLDFIGQVPVPNSLAVGVPQTVSLHWTVGAGVPQHSCIFAVVRSDAENDGDQSALDWASFEALCRSDNDWAQRNLDIQNFGSGNTGDGNTAESAPFIIRIPRLEQETVRLALEVDATDAAELVSLALEVPGRARYEAEPGGQVTLQLQQVMPGEDVVVVLQAVLKGGLPAGRTFTVNVNPTVESQALVGFAARFRVGRDADVVRQALDLSAAAFFDLWELAEFPVARHTLARLRPLVADPPSLPELAAELVRFDELAQQEEALARHPVLARMGSAEALKEWRAAVVRFEGGAGSPEAVVHAFAALARRLEAGSALIAEQARDSDTGTLGLAGAGADAVRVVLDRIEIRCDRDLLGPGEFYFVSEVETKAGRVVRRRFPQEGQYSLEAGHRTATVHLDAPVFEGEPGAALCVRVEAREVDPFGMEERLQTYERQLDGGPEAMRGTYAPGDEPHDPERRVHWNLFYRVV